MWRQKLKKILITAVKFVTNPRFLLCFGVGWIITNGWAYVGLAIGTLLELPWLIAACGTYMAFLWFPFTPEKLITVTIAIFLLKRFFPNDKKTLAVLIDLHRKVKVQSAKAKEWLRKKREEKSSRSEKSNLGDGNN